MKTLVFLLLFYSSILFCQTRADQELFFYQDGYGDIIFTYKLKPIISAVWDNTGIQRTVDGDGHSVFSPLPINLEGRVDQPTGGDSSNGMDYILSGTGHPQFGNSLYEVTCKINGSEQAYFYLDTRDCNYPNSSSGYNDFTIKYIHNKGKEKRFYIAEGKGIKFDSSKFKEVTDSVISFWETEPISGPDVSCFDQYWENCLGLGRYYYYYPFFLVRLIWGPHPTFTTTNYKIYRGKELSPGIIKYIQLATVDSKTFEYIDEETHYNSSEQVYYYVKAYNSKNHTYSGKTNVVHTLISKNLPKSQNEKNNNQLMFRLNQNYPNPFNPSTTITYELPKREYVTLKVYNSLGKEIAVLVEGQKEAGNYSVTFNAKSAASGLPSGLYLYKLTAGKYTKVRKMILLK